MKIVNALSFLAIVCLVFPVLASAELSTLHLSSDQELLQYLSDTMFVCEGRIGDRGGYQTFELCLGQSTSAPATTANYDWINGVAEPFTLTYDNVTGLVTYSLGGEILSYTTPYFDFEVFFVRTRAVEEGSSIVVTGLMLDGESVGDSSGASGPNGLDILLIVGGLLNDGFTLTGTATLSWTGAAPTQSRLAFQVKVAKPAVIGTGTSSWGTIKEIYR